MYQSSELFHSGLEFLAVPTPWRVEEDQYIFGLILHYFVEVVANQLAKSVLKRLTGDWLALDG